MKIACLQFAPQVGDVDNNIGRADAVLRRANPDDLDSLDLLVLPELAFTGYNFKSLQHISPFLEEADCGISSLWARTTALKHDCTVVVGYAEKVDVSAKWPASPEYYNSALLVNGDGDTVGNYRKAFLYYTDETWALEGGDGFFRGKISELGNVALGICTDLNPYKLEAPWDAFEFGFHALEAQANVVILTMAWQTHQDPSLFNRSPSEPDLETLVYWVQRLEPLIRAEKEGEIIVVFCNRAGAEGEATYTGTSTVIGINGGEVLVYGVLGRGVNDLLVVDTERPPQSKLTDANHADVDAYLAEDIALDMDGDGAHSPGLHDDILADECLVCQCQCQPPDSASEARLDSPRKAASPRLPWLAQSGPAGETSTDSRSPTRLQIPTRPQFDEYVSIDSAVTDDILVDGPGSLDSPIRRPPRSRMATPASPWRFPPSASPYPWHYHDASRSSVFGGGAAMTPITPFDEDGWSSTPIDPKPSQWFWKHEPTLSALAESAREEDEETAGPPQAQPPRSAHEEKRGPSIPEPQTMSGHEANNAKSEREMTASEDLSKGAPEAVPPGKEWADFGSLEELSLRPNSPSERPSRVDRPRSPKSRNLSRSTSPSRLLNSSEPFRGEQESTAAGSALDSNLQAPSSTSTRETTNGRVRNERDTLSPRAPPLRPASWAGPTFNTRGSLDAYNPEDSTTAWRAGSSRRQPCDVPHAVTATAQLPRLLRDDPHPPAATPHADDNKPRDRPPPPLSMDTAVASIRGTTTSPPGLCSAMSASTCDDDEPVMLLLRDYGPGLEQAAVSLEGSGSAAAGKGDVVGDGLAGLWLPRQV